MKPSQIALFFCCFLISLQPVLESLHHCIAELWWHLYKTGIFVILRGIVTQVIIFITVVFAQLYGCLTRLLAIYLPSVFIRYAVHLREAEFIRAVEQDGIHSFRAAVTGFAIALR